MSQAFIEEIRDFQAAITFNRPEKHNALEISDLEALDAALLRIAALPTIRVLILQAVGKSFCSGVDLGAVGRHDWRDSPLERVADRLENLPFPTLCVLQGGVYGGGTDLALACDFRLGVTGIRTFVPPAKLGIQYHPHGIRRVVSRLGLGPAKRLFLLAETLDHNEMLRTGFLDWITTPEELDARKESITATIAGLAPQPLRGMKQSLNEIAAGLFDERAARERFAASFHTEDAVEGRAAMAAKRAPVFTGR